MRFTSRESVGPLNTLRHAERVAVEAYDDATQDVPLCPASLANPSPSLPEEPGDRLEPAQRVAIAAIVAGQTFAMAARAAGISRRTLYRWRQEPAFKQAVDQLSIEALDASVTRVRNLMLRATRVMSEALVGNDAARSAYRVLNSARLWKILEGARSVADESVESVSESSSKGVKDGIR